MSAATDSTDGAHGTAAPARARRPLQGRDRRQVDHHDRPQGHRQPLLHHLVRLVHARRHHGAAHPRRARQPRAAGRRQPRAVQPAVHDARHDHAAALRDAAVRRLRQRAHAAADRRARRRVPAAEHVRLLALPLRRPHRRRRLPHPRWRGRVRLVRLRPAVRQHATAPGSAATCGSSASRSPVSARSSVRSTSSPRSSACARPA